MWLEIKTMNRWENVGQSENNPRTNFLGKTNLRGRQGDNHKEEKTEQSGEELGKNDVRSQNREFQGGRRCKQQDEDWKYPLALAFADPWENS